MDWVWVRRLNKVGLVHEVRRSARGEVDYYLVRVPAGDAGLVTVPTSRWEAKAGLTTVLADRWDIGQWPSNAVPLPGELRAKPHGGNGTATRSGAGTTPVTATDRAATGIN